MAQVQRAHLQPVPGVSSIVPDSRIAPEAKRHDVELARLSALHEEARETAELANLLGRAPMVAASLVAAAALTATLGQSMTAPAETIAWLILMLVGVGALLRAYAQAIRAPFERAPLKAFSEDAKSVLLYAGFAWGAGAFLALPDYTGSAGAVLFAAAGAGLVAFAIRSVQHSFVFLIPAAGLTAFACVLRPLEGGPLAAALVLVGCALVAAVMQHMDRRLHATLPKFTGIPAL